MSKEYDTRDGSILIGGKWVCEGCGHDPCRCHWDDYDPQGEDEEADTDVCQNCGGFFAWTADLAETWRRLWRPTEGQRQPQRCRRCLVDECWIEDREP